MVIAENFKITREEINKIEAYATRQRASVLVIFFDDIQNSTVIKQEIATQFGEEAFQKLRREHDLLLTEIITREDAGEVVKSTGDGLLAVFAEPTTAVGRALEIQESYKGHPHIHLRIGLDMGQVRIERAGGVQEDMFGRHVDWASRAESMAEGGHILVTKSIYNDASDWLSRGSVSWKMHGHYSLKEGEKPIELFEPYNANLIEPMAQPRGTKAKCTGAAGKSAQSFNVQRRFFDKYNRQLMTGVIITAVITILIVAFTRFPQSTEQNKQTIRQSQLLPPPTEHFPAPDVIRFFSSNLQQKPTPIKCSSKKAYQEVYLENKEISWSWHNKTAAFCGWILEGLPITRFTDAFMNEFALVIEYTGAYQGHPSPQIKFIDGMGSCTRLVELGTYLKTTAGNVKAVTIPMTAFKLEPAIHMLNPASSMDKNNPKPGFDTDNIKAIQFDAGWDSPEGDIIIKTIYFQKIK